MRHLAEPTNLKIDPWAFARNRQNINGNMSLANAQMLERWLGDTQSTVEFTFFGDVDEHKQSHLSGRLETTLHIQCQRCLEMMDLPIKYDFDYVLIRHQSQENQITGSSESFICSEDELDLAWFIGEEILLAMPMIAKHKNCNVPQMDTNEVVAEEPTTQNPFAQLKNMIEAQENTHGSSTKS